MIDVPAKSTIDDITAMGMDKFFPNGESKALGKKNRYVVDGLGTTNDMFNDADFKLTDVIELYGGASKTRLYMYTTLIQVIIKKRKCLQEFWVWAHLICDLLPQSASKVGVFHFELQCKMC